MQSCVTAQPANGDGPDQPYSKWKASSNDVRVNITMEKSRCGPFPVPNKKIFLKVIIGLILGLLVGFVVGYVVGWTIHKAPPTASQPEPSGTTTPAPSSAPLGFSSEVYQRVLGEVTTENVVEQIRDFETNLTQPGSAASAAEITRIQTAWGTYRYPTVVNMREMLFPDTFNFSLTNSTGAVIVDTSMASPVSYSSSGNIPASSAVFVNYGTASDFANRAGAGVSVSQTIVAILLGGEEDLWVVIDRAASAGAVGVVFFASPSDFPNIPQHTAVTVNAKQLSGDPLTPNLGVQPAGTYQLPDSVGQGTRIPAVVLPYTVAMAMFSDVSLPANPPVLTAATSAQFTMTVDYSYAKRSASTAILGVRGAPVADRFVFIGTHHDQVNPGADPATGRAIHNTVLHTLTQAIADGLWQPRRALIFVSFDGSTMDIGAREWLEENRLQYEDRGVAYFNLANSVTGSTFQAQATGLLTQVVKAAANDAGLGADVPSEDVTGRGDHVAFTDYLGIPAIEMQYVNETHHEDFRSVGNTNLPQGDAWIATLVSAHISAIMRVADSLFLPYDLLEIVTALENGNAALQQWNQTQYFAGLDDQVSAIGNAITSGSNFLRSFESSKAGANASQISDIKLRVINDVQQSVFRVYLHPIGVPMVRVGQIMPNINNRNMLSGRTSTKGGMVRVFPGVAELFEALSASPDQATTDLLQAAIQTHLSEILAAVDLMADYLVRAVRGGALFQP